MAGLGEERRVTAFLGSGVVRRFSVVGYSKGWKKNTLG